MLASKAADRTEARLFDNLTAIRAIEAQAKPRPHAARRSGPARRGGAPKKRRHFCHARTAGAVPPAGIATPEPPGPGARGAVLVNIEPFTDVEVL